MSNKLHIVKVHNPFQPRDREIREVDHRLGAALAAYIDDRAEDLVIAHNGRIVPADRLTEIIPRPGDSIAICPRVAGGGDAGKNIAQILAMIALTVVTFGVGSVVAGGAFMGAGFISAAYWGWSSFIAAAITSIAGAYLINTLFPAPEAPQPKPQWGTLAPIDRQGSVVGMTYGTIRTGGTILQRRVVLDGDKQYLYYLATGGEEVDEISSIKIGDQPIENYRDVLVDLRMGTNDQDPIPGFDDTYQTQVFSYNLDTTWRTQLTEGATGTGLELIFECPQGLYHRKNSGDLENATVILEAQYRRVGDLDWIPWAVIYPKQDNTARYHSGTQFYVQGDRTADFPVGLVVTMLAGDGRSIAGTVTDSSYGYPGITIVTVNASVPTNIYAVRWSIGGDWTITAAEASPVRRVYRKTGLPAGQYEVQIRCAYKSGTGDNYATDVYWTALSHIIEDDFRRPGKNQVGIRALATDQLSGALPAVTWIQTRNNVWVWDPAVSQYVQKPAYNPAWMAYDLIHQARRVKNIHTGQYEFIVRGYPADRIIYQEFADWAAFCEANDLRCDYYYEQEMTLWDALKIPGNCGHGMAILRGTRWGAIYDGPADPVQLFTIGNIGEDSFEEQFTSTLDRAQALEITYADQELDYEKTTLIVYPEGWDTSQTVTSPARIDLPGVTRRSQAYAEAVYRLRLLKLVRVVSWTADVDALACQVGDVVAVAHDVPQWGYSGRLAADATADTLTLDREVEMAAGKTYAAMLRMPDDALIEKALVNKAGTFLRSSVAYLSSGQQVAAGQPRFEAGKFGQALEVEEGTTNLLLYSEAFDDATWAKARASVTANAAVAPNGAATADKLVEDTTASNTHYVMQTKTKAAEQITYTASVYAKKAERTKFALWISGNLLANGAQVVFNLDAGTVGTPIVLGNFPSINLKAAITAIGNGWYRCELTFTTNTDTNVRWTIHLMDVTVTYTGDGASGLYIWGAQLEQKAYATGYMATTSAAITRSPETLTIPGSVLSATEGTVECWVKLLRSPGTNEQVILDGAGPANQNLQLVVRTDGKLEARYGTGTATVAVTGTTVLARDTWYAVAVRWSSAGAALLLNGAAQASNTTAPSLAFGANAYLGSRTDGTLQLDGLLDSLRISSRARTDAEIAAAYASGEPLPVDEYTTGLWQFDGDLSCRTRQVQVQVPFDPDTEPASYVDGTHFAVTGDRTADYPAGRAIVLIHADAERETVVIGSVYDSVAGLTTVEVTGPVELDLELVRYRFTLPRKYDVYSFGRIGIEVKPFRLLNVARSGDLQFRLTGLEYDASIYDPIGAAPPIQYSELVPVVSGIRVTESVDTTGYVWLHIGWTPPRERYNGARVLIDGRQVARVPASQTRFDYMLRSFAPVTIKIVAVDFDGNDFGEAETTYQTLGDIYPPSAPSGLVVESIQGGFSVKFDRPPEHDWRRSEVYASTTQGFTPGPDNRVAAGQQTYFEITAGLELGQTYYVKVRHYDWAGNASAASAEMEVIAGRYQGTAIEPATVPYGALDPLMTAFLRAVVADPCVVDGWRLPSNVQQTVDCPAIASTFWTRIRDISGWIFYASAYVGIFSDWDEDYPPCWRDGCSALRFNLDAIPAGATILSAELILYCIDVYYDGISRQISIHKNTSNFSDSSLPSYETSPRFYIPQPVINQKSIISGTAIKQLVEEWLSSSNYGIFFKHIELTDKSRYYYYYFGGVNYPDPAKRPVLRVTYQPVAGDLRIPITAGSGYHNGKLINTNFTSYVDFIGHPDGTYYVAAIYDALLNVTIDHLSYTYLTAAATAGDNYIRVGAVPEDWAAGKLIHIGIGNERHKILSIDGTTVNLDGTTLAAGYAAGTLVSLATPPETGMILGTVTKSGTTLTYDMSPKTGRKDLALSFAKFGVTDANNGSDPPGGHIWISPWTYVTNNNYYDFTHNLDSYDTLITVEFKDTTQNIIRIATDTDEIYTNQYWRRGTSVQKISKNIVRVYTGQNSVQIEVKVGGVQEFTSGYLRVIVQKIK